MPRVTPADTDLEAAAYALVTALAMREAVDGVADPVLRHPAYQAVVDILEDRMADTPDADHLRQLRIVG